MYFTMIAESKYLKYRIKPRHIVGVLRGFERFNDNMAVF